MVHESLSSQNVVEAKYHAARQYLASLILNVLSINYDISRKQEHLASHIDPREVLCCRVNSSIVIVINSFFKFQGASQRIIFINNTKVILLMSHVRRWES